MRNLWRSTFAALAAVSLIGCDVPPPPHGPAEQHAPSPASGPELKQRQIAFLNRLRDADPKGNTIDRAVLNEENELGLILDRSVEMEKIPALMRTMLAQMAREFPGENLNVIAYTPSVPPHKIGTAHLDARSRDMTYTPAR